MECPKCHSQMTDTQRICEKCGWERHHFPGGVNTLDEKKESVLPSKASNFMQMQNVQAPSSNVDLLDVFIGNNREKIKKGGFNFAAFFFGFFYYCYRKMYLFGILFYLVCSIINAILTNYFDIFWLPYLISFVLFFILSFMTNKLYVGFAKRKIEKLRKQNPNLDDQKFSLLVQSKGGTSVAGIFVLLGFILAITAILTMVAAKLTMHTINKTKDSFTLIEAEGALNTIRLDVTIKSAEEKVPSNTKLPILDYLRYQPPGCTINGGTFMLTGNDEIEVFNLELQIYDHYYLCNGGETDLSCTEK